MSDKALQMAEMIEMLPAQEQALDFEMLKRIVLAWDPDFTKLTPKERKELEEAENDTEYISHNAINWD